MRWLRTILVRLFGRGRSVFEKPGVAKSFAQFPNLRPTLAQGAINVAEEAIAGFAWLNYSKGAERGVVWVSQSIGCYGGEMIAALQQMLYIQQDRLQALLGNPDDPLIGTVQRYDPENEVLIVVHQDQQSEFYFLLKPSIPLPQAGKRMCDFIQTVSRDRLPDDAPFGHVAALYYENQGRTNARS